MLRRLVSLALGLSLAVAALPTGRASAQAARVVVNGQLMVFDQPPVVAGGRMLVPLRGVFEHLGATVLWNPATNVVTAQRGDTQVQLVIGGRQASVNGRVVLLDVPATIVRGRTLVPLRFVSEAMGAYVDWDNATRVVTITSGTTALPVQRPAPAPQPVPVQPPPPAPPPAPAILSVVEGRVLRVDGQRILVEENGVIRTFMLTSTRHLRPWMSGRDAARRSAPTRFAQEALSTSRPTPRAARSWYGCPCVPSPAGSTRSPAGPSPCPMDRSSHSPTACGSS
jgi:hypothetical protein